MMRFFITFVITACVACSSHRSGEPNSRPGPNANGIDYVTLVHEDGGILEVDGGGINADGCVRYGLDYCPFVSDDAVCNPRGTWSTIPRGVDAGSCPPRQRPNCDQAVIGYLADTARYIDCPGYVVLNRSDWTLQLNDAFIGCIVSQRIDGLCDDTPAIIVTPDIAPISELTAEGFPKVTSREICEFANCGCSLTLANVHGKVGYVARCSY